MHYLIFFFKAQSLRTYLLRSRYVSSAAPNTPLHSIRWPRVSPEQNQKVICVGGAHPFLLGGLYPFLKGPPSECPAALSSLWHGPWQLQQASRWCRTGALSPQNGSSMGRGKDMGFRVRQTCVLFLHLVKSLILSDPDFSAINSVFHIYLMGLGIEQITNVKRTS